MNQSLSTEPSKFKKFKIPFLIVVVLGAALSISTYIPSPSIEEHTIQLNRLPDEVWTIINDIEGYEKWWPKAAKVMNTSARTPDGSQPESWKVILPDQKTQDMIVVTTYERPSKLVRTVEGSFGEKTWTFHLTPEGDHTSLKVSENGNFAEYLVHSVTGSVGFNSRLGDFVEHLDQLLSN